MYLGLAYLSHATEHFYVYAFLDPWVASSRLLAQQLISPQSEWSWPRCWSVHWHSGWVYHRFRDGTVPHSAATVVDRDQAWHVRRVAEAFIVRSTAWPTSRDDISQGHLVGSRWVRQSLACCGRCIALSACLLCDFGMLTSSLFHQADFAIKGGLFLAKKYILFPECQRERRARWNKLKIGTAASANAEAVANSKRPNVGGDFELHGMHVDI